MGGDSTPAQSTKTTTAQPWAPAQGYLEDALSQAASMFGGGGGMGGMGGQTPTSGFGFFNDPMREAIFGQDFGLHTGQFAPGSPSSGNTTDTPSQPQVDPSLQNAIDALTKFGQGSTDLDSPDINQAEDYYKDILNKQFDPNDVTKSAAYKSARDAIIPDVESRFNQAGALTGGAAPTAETGALGDAFGRLSEQEQARLAQEKQAAASGLGQFGENRQRLSLQAALSHLNALMEAAKLGQIPKQNILDYLRTLQGFMGQKQTTTGTEQDASGTDWGSGLLGAAMLAGKFL